MKKSDETIWRLTQLIQAMNIRFLIMRIFLLEKRKQFQVLFVSVLFKNSHLIEHFCNTYQIYIF